METWNETDEWADRYVRGDLSGEDRVALIKWLEASPEQYLFLVQSGCLAFT